MDAANARNARSRHVFPARIRNYLDDHGLHNDQCDERFPTCANCERSGRVCPGPKSRFIAYVEPGKEEHLDFGNSSATTLNLLPAHSADQELAYELVHRLESVQYVGSQLQMIGRFFHHLPSRVGHSAALDAALRALLHEHRAFIEYGSSVRTSEDVKDYSEALRLIRNDLTSHRSKTSTETICAALVLGLYEVRCHRFPCSRLLLTFKALQTGRKKGVHCPCWWSVGPH